MTSVEPAERSFDVVVVGELNVDLILRGEVTPEYGQVEKLLDDAALVLGSSSAIFACGCARLGLRVAFIGKVGDDTFGRVVKDELVARGIDVSAVMTDPTIKTGISVILARTGDRAILTYLGSISALRYEEIDLDLLARGRHMHAGAYFLLDALRPDLPKLCDFARAQGLTVSLDTNYDPSERWDVSEILRHVDIYLPNETELRAIAGIHDVPAALDQLARSVPTVAVKLGAAGALAGRGPERAQTAALDVAVVDTTGAGDSFDAGFVYAWLAGWKLPEALRLGVVCGSLSTTAAGGTAGQATLDEAMRALPRLNR